MKKTLLLLIVLIAGATAVATYENIKHSNDVIVTDAYFTQSAAFTTNNNARVELTSFDVPMYTSYLKTLSDSQLRDLYVESSTADSKNVVNRKADTTLHIGEFSQEQLPESTIGFYPRAYTPTTVQAFGTVSPTGRKPAEIYYAYGISGLTQTGAGQTVAVVIPAGSETLVNDMHVFSQYFGLPDANLTFLYPQGVPTVHSDSWALETSLDTQWIHAIAPQAKILVVVCNTASIAGLVQGIDAAVAAGAKIISLSWGSVEWSNQASYASHFNVNGVTFIAATGDSGYGTAWPSVEPTVLAVGGTQLVSSGTTGKVVEQAWSYGSGGVSKYYSLPSYQSVLVKSTMRNTPDVSLNACGYTIYCGNYQGAKGYLSVSGTSAAAPIWAGITALGYSGRKANPLSQLNTTLYSSAVTNYSGFYRDMTTGTQVNGKAAAVGYDNDTGLGVPIVPAIISTILSSK